ncbi:hypothetical protein V1499_07550 [Neobacillus sp. SCS-31]|uniref:hypothetical protein n=1 Tax=Neobacillus oceani TaxID=3115292 RepID=UPI003905C42D
MKDFFSTKIGHQTIATLVTLFSFLFLYTGGTQDNNSMLMIGIIMMLGGMLAVPVIGFRHAKKMPKKEQTKG